MLASLFGLIFLFPVLLAIGLLIRAEDGGPVFYRGVQVRRYGKPFRIFKFRTTVVNMEKSVGHPPLTTTQRLQRLEGLYENIRWMNCLNSLMI